MATKDRKSGWAASLAAGARQELTAGKAGASLQDRFALAESLSGGSRGGAPVVDVVRGPAEWLPLDRIRVRDDALRPVHEAHALDLALSIAAVGLIHFPVVNQHDELLAGGQRRAALELLQAFRTLAPDDIRRMYAAFTAPDDDLDGAGLHDDQVALLRAAWDRHFARGVPVHRIDTNALPGGAQALTIETIENEKRLDFSKAELANLVEKLRAAGFRDRVGRPRGGERTLAGELEAITGKSRRTVFRLLEELRTATATANPPERGPSETSRTLARRLTEHLALAVKVNDHPKKRGQGTIVIRYGSFQERADALRKLGLRD
jgi:hypothetical protein